MQGQSQYINDLQRAISTARFDAYRRPTDTEDLDAVARYLWNIALSEALYPTLQALEVTLRNSLNTAIGNHFNDPLWFDRQPSFMRQLELDKIAGAEQELLRTQKPLEAGRVVAELSFGFWTSLLDVYYEQILWRTLLKPAFPNMPRRIRTRRELSARLNRIRKLRNRVFHHESILNWHHPGLQPQHAQVLEIIGWMNRDMRDSIALIDRFPAVNAQGSSFYHNRVEQYLRGRP